VIYCHKRDVTLSLELGLNLAMQCLLVALDRQEEVGPLLLELPKNGRWVCKASELPPFSRTVFRELLLH